MVPYSLQVRVLLDAEQPDVDLLRPSWPVGWEPLEQLRQAPAAPVPPNLPGRAGHQWTEIIQNQFSDAFQICKQ